MNHIDINKLLRGKKPVNITIDKDAKAIYFKVSDHMVSKTVRPNASLSVDYDEHNDVVGVEIIRVRRIEQIFKMALKDISSAIPSNILTPA